MTDWATCHECFAAASRHGGGLMALRHYDGVRHWARKPRKPRTKAEQAMVTFPVTSFCGEVSRVVVR